MKNYTLYKTERFNSCHAGTGYFEDEATEIQVFYSYTCPELVKIGGKRYKFTYEDSRKAGERTESRTTSRQLTQYYGRDWRELDKINLGEFEQNYFNTRLTKYPR